MCWAWALSSGLLFSALVYVVLVVRGYLDRARTARQAAVTRRNG